MLCRLFFFLHFFFFLATVQSNKLPTPTAACHVSLVSVAAGVVVVSLLRAELVWCAAASGATAAATVAFVAFGGGAARRRGPSYERMHSAEAAGGRVAVVDAAGGATCRRRQYRGQCVAQRGAASPSCFCWWREEGRPQAHERNGDELLKQLRKRAETNWAGANRWR